MCQALGQAKRILQKWLAQHTTSFPPVMIHITDGESTDGDPSQAMRELASLSSNDAVTFYFSTCTCQAIPTQFPPLFLILRLSCPINSQGHYSMAPACSHPSCVPLQGSTDSDWVRAQSALS